MTRRIAMISEHASPLSPLGGADSGGQNVYVGQIARGLADMGYEVDVFTRRDDERLPEVAAWAQGVRVVYVPAGPACPVPKEDLLPYMGEFTNFVLRFCQSEQRSYDLTHANFWMSGLVALELKQQLSIPFVVTFHALGRVRRLHQGEADGFPDERFAIEERIVSEADRIIAECPQDEVDLTELYNADSAKITIVPCGFDPAEIWPISKPLARLTLGLPTEERIILQLGRMVPRKGVETAIRGFAKLVREHGIAARLLVVGGESDDPDPVLTPEIGRLQAIAAEEQVSEAVIFAGRCSRESLKYFYSAADIFVTTPWYEPFGITPVEAMACGTPVIGSNVGGVKFSVRDGETGYLVAPRDATALAERMAKLCQHPDLMAQFGQQAIRRVNDLFTWRKVTSDIAQLYEEVLTARRLTLSNRSNPMDVVDSNFRAAAAAFDAARECLREPIIEAGARLVDCIRRDGKILVCGNGGSAAESQHFAAELVGRFRRPGRRGLPMISLNSDTAVLTAWANDIGYDDVFARQVEAYGRPGDVLVGISTSGQSRNLLRAFETARKRGVETIAILGRDGGELRELADLSLIVPAFDSQRIQEVQMLLVHLLSELVEEELCSEDPNVDSSLVSMPVAATVQRLARSKAAKRRAVAQSSQNGVVA